MATPEQAQEVHAYIRKWLGDKVSQDVSSATRIIYGALCITPHHCKTQAMLWPQLTLMQSWRPAA